MNVIITMAGEGRRFTEAGYKQRKYEVTVKGRTLFEWALLSLSAWFDQAEFTFVARPGSENFIREKCELLGIIVNKDTKFKDKEFEMIRNHIGADQIYRSLFEGCFFKKEIFAEMLTIINQYYKYGDGYLYPREQYYYPTIISKIVEESRNAQDRLTMKYAVYSVEELKEFFGQRESGGYYKYFKAGNYYSIKRVARQYNDPLRTYIRSLNNFKLFQGNAIFNDRPLYMGSRIGWRKDFKVFN